MEATARQHGASGTASGAGFEPVRGGIGAAERAADTRGVGMAPTKARNAPSSRAAAGGSEGSGASSLESQSQETSQSSGKSGGITQTVAAVAKGLAGLVSGKGGERDTSDRHCRSWRWAVCARTTAG
ncbi:hypothetical protein Agub_g8196, partial [Astrephomene gubernaculifera]